MAITTANQLVTAIAGGQTVYTDKASMVAIVGTYQSLWTAGIIPAAGGTPAASPGAVPTNATVGAIPYLNPSAASVGYLAGCDLAGANAITLTIYDRLVHTSGMFGNETAVQTVNSTALTRYTSGVGVQCWLEVYTALGVTSASVSVEYTNQSGVSGRGGTATIVASATAGTSFPVALAQGDTGVQSVQSCQLSISTGTAGNFGITLGYDLTTIGLMNHLVEQTNDYAQIGLPVIQPNACLAYRVLPTLTSTGALLANFLFVQG